MLKIVLSTAATVSILMSSELSAQSAEVNLFSSVAVTGIINELVPQFEKASGNKVIVRFDIGPAVKKRIEAGEAFDVTILAPGLIDQLTKSGEVAAGTSTPIARTGVGIAVRPGIPKPDLSSIDAFKNTLRAVKSIGMIDPATGAAGPVNAMKMIERVGMTDEVKSKLKLYSGVVLPKPVVDGEVDIWLDQITEIVSASSIVLAGPVPAELQIYTIFTAGISPRAKENKAVVDLVRFLTSPSALPVIKAKGMEAS
jgi:molybdate transport system substrate-binding protein